MKHILKISFLFFLALSLASADECMEGDCENGTGTYFYSTGDKSGSKFTGEWKNGKRDGKGIMLNKDGSFFEGEYKNDMKHGEGAFYPDVNAYHEGKKGILQYVGNWKNDKRHGKFTKVFNNHVSEEIEYVNGKLISNVKSNSNGVMSVTDVLLDYDSLVGKWIVVKGHYLNLDGTSGALKAGFTSFTSLDIYTKNAERSIRKYLLENCDSFGCNLEVSGYVKKTKKTKRKYIDLRKIKISK